MASSSTERPIVKVKIHRTHSRPSVDDHREWDVRVQIYPPDSEPNSEPDIEVKILRDPFVSGDYANYERSSQNPNIVQAPFGLSDLSRALPQDMRLEISTESATSYYPSQSSASGMNEPTDLDDDISERSKIDEYSFQLRQDLGLDRWWNSRYTIKISISEDCVPVDQDEDHYSSIHSLLWELLEYGAPDVDAVRQDQPVVQITRRIAGISEVKLLPSLCGSDAPISLLLVLARSLRRPTEDALHDAASVVHDTLYAMKEYLNSKGRHDRLSIEVVRPGSFQELVDHLNSGKLYDMVHFDVHGVLDENNNNPMLCFAQPNAYSKPATERLDLGEQSVNRVPVQEVAKLLEEHNIRAVALSACLSSYSQGKPLSNMCRVFANSGVSAVTGMSFTVKNTAAAAYYDGFYTALILSNCNFRSAALFGRLSLERHQKEQCRENCRQNSAVKCYPHLQDCRDQMWPMATTYFTAEDPFRTNSMNLGEDTYDRDSPNSSYWELCRMGNSISATNKYIIFCLLIMSSTCVFFFLFVRIIAATCLVVLFCGHIWRVRNTQPDTELSRFEKSKKALKENGIQHSVALMLLEDRLTTRKELYIEFNPPYHQPEYLRSLRSVWTRTKFADTVEIVHASRFKWQLVFCFLFHVMRHFVSQQMWKLRQSRRPLATSRKPRTILIIEGLEEIINGSFEGSGYPLSRMHAYIQRMKARHPSEFYLIMIGSHKVEWSKPKWKVNKYTWTEAPEFIISKRFTFMTAKAM